MFCWRALKAFRRLNERYTRNEIEKEGIDTIFVTNFSLNMTRLENHLVTTPS